MHVDKLEKTWVWIVALIILVMLGSIFYSAFAISVHPPSNVETIDSTRLHLTDEFAEDNLGVFTNPDGSVVFEMTGAAIPVGSSQVAAAIMVSKYFRKAGVGGEILCAVW